MKSTGWLILGAVVVVIGYGVLTSVIGSLSSDEATTSVPQRSAPDARQTTYNQLLSSARQNVRDDPEVSCEPALQSFILDQIDAPGGQKALLQLAMTDACKEAGLLSGVAQYSPYHANAP